jgi:hypothetical protein
MKAFGVIIVLLVILIGVYAVTRGLPGPNPPLAPCKQNSDCPAPQVCVSGTCADPALPGLIQAAQGAAQALYGALQTAATAYGSGGSSPYLAHATSLQSAAIAMGLSSPPLGNLAADLTSGLADIAKYVNFLSVPGCDVTRSVACGYYAETMALTPATSPGVILAVANSASSTAAELPVTTAAFPPVVADLGNVTGFVTADAEAKNKGLDSNTSYWLGVVGADTTQANGFTALLTQQAKAVAQTGWALYNHMLSGG